MKCVRQGSAVRLSTSLVIAALGAAVLGGCSSKDEAPAAQSNTAQVTAVLTSQTGSDRHPCGATFDVMGVQKREKSIAVAFQAINGHSEVISLNTRGAWLVDNVGNIYKFQPPAQNGALKIPSGAKMTGTMVFLGDLAPEATSVTLRVNVSEPEAKHDVDPSKRNSRDTNPKFEIVNLEVSK